MTEGITITAAQVQKGDKIRVTVPRKADEDRELVITYTGTAHLLGRYSGDHWETEKGWLLYTASDGAVIELLDRPKPVIKLPTNTYAQVTYERSRHSGGKRFAVLTPSGDWKAYDKDGEWMDTKGPTAMHELVNSAQVSNVEVIFEGVAK